MTKIKIERKRKKQSDRENNILTQKAIEWHYSKKKEANWLIDKKGVIEKEGNGQRRKHIDRERQKVTGKEMESNWQKRKWEKEKAIDAKIEWHIE